MLYPKPTKIVYRGREASVGLAFPPSQNPTSFRSAIKPARSDWRVPGDNVAEAAVASVSGPTTFVDPEDGNLNQWLFTLSATQTAALAEGNYYWDARFTIGAGVQAVNPVRVQVVNSVTGAGA